MISDAVEFVDARKDTRAVNFSATPSTRRRRIKAIASNTFREAVRDKILYNLVLFALLLISGSIFLSGMSAAQEFRVIVNLGLGAVLLFGAFIAIFVGVGLVYKELERRTVYSIFAKPVGRGEFLVGKYLGLCVTLLVNVLIMGVGVTLALLYVRRPHDPSVFVIWPAILLLYLQLTILTAVALLFSSFSSPALSSLLTFFVFIIGNFSADLKTFASSMGTSGAQWFFSALYYVLPNLSQLSPITLVAYGKTPEPETVFIAVIYSVAYISVLLAASTLVFNRRNFK